MCAARRRETGLCFTRNALGNNKENPSSLLTRPDRKKTVGKPNNPPCSRGQGRQKRTRPGGTGRKRLIHACYTGLKLHLIHHVNQTVPNTHPNALKENPEEITAKKKKRDSNTSNNKSSTFHAKGMTLTEPREAGAIYGSKQSAKLIRTFKDGKLRLGKDDLLLLSDDGIPISGDVRNFWAGLSVLQALFIKEHNAICDMLKEQYLDLDDEELYRHARLVTSAIIAKIHTIDWTVELLKTDTLLAGMRANWYGLLGKWLKDMFGHTGSSILSGFVGMAKPQNHGIPFSLTEEFVSVYRMHSLMPENLLFRDIHGNPAKNKTPPMLKEVDLRKLIGTEGERTLSEIGSGAMIVSMGHQSSGALQLWNYPTWMRDLIPQDPDGQGRPDHIDLAALEIYRDRERSVSRYNEFRRNMLMIPIKKWEDLTNDKKAIQVLREVYGNDVESLDLLIGLMAEKKIAGYAISETAFFIFLLMASRRLETDRFFTSDFNEEVYTKEGLARVNSTESLKDVLNRHYPEMVEKWMNSSSAFSVWSASPEPVKFIPLYLRFPKLLWF
ncbi:hypothetical protein KI387_008760 [Taxus chinensis]|uniref:Uncharacterized protein n=1 Tax=Taxus chinensis TaxID=29808 RepID=A0AA38CMJ2_TAXCH|nr:hypothetical protein KI387_008760 [Taxus chinensis]